VARSLLGPCCCCCCRFVYRFQATTTTLLQKCSKHIESSKQTPKTPLPKLYFHPQNREVWRRCWCCNCFVGVFTHFKCQFRCEAHKMADFPHSQWWSSRKDGELCYTKVLKNSSITYLKNFTSLFKHWKYKMKINNMQENNLRWFLRTI